MIALFREKMGANIQWCKRLANKNFSDIFENIPNFQLFRLIKGLFTFFFIFIIRYMKFIGSIYFHKKSNKKIENLIV